MSRSRRHLRRESTHLLLTSCNVFGLDPNCKQQTSPPRAPGGVELLYSRQHAVFSEAAACVSLPPTPAPRAHSLAPDISSLAFLRTSSVLPLSAAPVHASSSPQIPNHVSSFRKACIILQIRFFCKVYALNTSGMHTFSSLFGHPQIPNQASSSSYMSGKTCIVLEIRRFGENSALNSSGVHAFSCVFGRCLVTAAKPQSCTVFKLRFGKTCIVLEIRRFGENSALNSSGVHIFSCVFGRCLLTASNPHRLQTTFREFEIRENYALNSSGVHIFSCVFGRCLLAASKPQSCTVFKLRFGKTCIVFEICRFGENSALKSSGVHFFSCVFGRCLLTASNPHRLQTAFRENLHRLRDTRFGENSALNTSGVHIFLCLFGRCLLTASNP